MKIAPVHKTALAGKTLLLAMALCAASSLVAQKYYPDYLARTDKALLEGDCSNARIWYEIYRQIRNDSCERTRLLIEACSDERAVHFFEAGSIALNGYMFHTLDLWVDNLLQYPKVNISLRGFCEDTYSRSLAEEMAQAVKNYLIYKGIDAQRIAVYGSTSPTDANAGAALNDYRRRVEFAIEN